MSCIAVKKIQFVPFLILILTLYLYILILFSKNKNAFQTKIDLTPISIESIMKPKCEYGTLSKYGQVFNFDPIRWGRGNSINISTALGCSVNKKYCNGAIKAIPCCIKILFDMWHEIDKYFVKHNVTYSLSTGSLLMAVRDGRHAQWDAQDIDLNFLYPLNKSKLAITEFIEKHQLTMNGIHHIMDFKQMFIKYHHEKYGYPLANEKYYCFYNNVDVDDLNQSFYVKKVHKKLHKRKGFYQWKELVDNEDALILGGSTGFIDFYHVGINSNGMGNFATHIDDSFEENMIEVQYLGSNDILPPRKIYVFPEYYKLWYEFYGDKWPQDQYFDVVIDHQFVLMDQLLYLLNQCIMIYFQNYLLLKAFHSKT
eukprot:19559_1